MQHFHLNLSSSLAINHSFNRALPLCVYVSSSIHTCRLLYAWVSLTFVPTTKSQQPLLRWSSAVKLWLSCLYFIEDKILKLSPWQAVEAYMVLRCIHSDILRCRLFLSLRSRIRQVLDLIVGKLSKWDNPEPKVIILSAINKIRF
jgi:hypothetical protein